MSQVVVRGQGDIREPMLLNQGPGGVVFVSLGQDGMKQAGDHQCRHATCREDGPACGSKHGTKQCRVGRRRFQNGLSLMTLTALLQVLEQGHGDFRA